MLIIGPWMDSALVALGCDHYCPIHNLVPLSQFTLLCVGFPTKQVTFLSLSVQTIP
jgi:hypothetical protein